MLYVIIAKYGETHHVPDFTRALCDVPDDIPCHLTVIENPSPEQKARGFGAAPVHGDDLIGNERNLGCAASWNHGIRIAIENAADAILIAGHDTCPGPRTIVRLWNLLQEGLLFVTGTQLPWGAQTVENIPPTGPLLAAPDFSFFMFRPDVVQMVGNYDANLDFQIRSGSRVGEPLPAAIMRPWDWGLFDSRYALAYVEDNDFHLRMHKAGVQALRDPGAYFRHDCSLTMRANPEIDHAIQGGGAFKRNLDLYRAKWGHLPAESDLLQARPLNVTDAEWKGMTGGREVQYIEKTAAIEAARTVYARYGVKL